LSPTVYVLYLWHRDLVYMLHETQNDFAKRGITVKPISYKTVQARPVRQACVLRG